MFQKDFDSSSSNIEIKKCKFLQIIYAFIPSSMHIIVQIILFTSLEVRECDKVKTEALLRHKC